MTKFTTTDALAESLDDECLRWLLLEINSVDDDMPTKPARAIYFHQLREMVSETLGIKGVSIITQVARSMVLDEIARRWAARFDADNVVREVWRERRSESSPDWKPS